MLCIRPATPADLDVVLALRLALLREHGGNAVYGRLRDDAEARARSLFASQLADAARPGASEVILLAEQARARARPRAVGILRCLEGHGSPLLHPARYGYVASVYVLPAARRRGVLRRLLAEATAWCTARGLDEMRLHSAADNPLGNAAWEALGFEVVEYLRVRRLGDGEERERA